MKLKSLIQPQSRHLQQGFSLVEVTVGMGVMGTCVVALFSGFTSGFFTMQLARENQRATQIMLEKVETIRLYRWDQVTPAFIPSSFTNYYDPQSPSQGPAYVGALSITPVAGTFNSSYSNDLKMVTVTVNWKTGRLPRTRSFTTYVARNGLQTYIY